MPDAIDFRRLRYTPFRDVLRGRLTGALDWRARVAAAALPAAAEALIVDVVRRARLWSTERVPVADELVAHFADGLSGGASADDLVRDFGDARGAARLIRRAKQRGRPLAWHAATCLTRAVLVLSVAYGVLLLRFVTARPSVRVDYAAALNAPTASRPASELGWPLYRAAIEANPLGFTQGDPALRRPLARQPIESPDANRLDDATPDDPEWPQWGAWLDARAGQMALFRRAAACPAIGFVYDVADLGGGRGQGVRMPDPTERPEVPNANLIEDVGVHLLDDARWARDQRQPRRLADDLIARLDLAAQLRDGTLAEQSAANGFDDVTLRELLATLRDAPAALDDATLVALAHRVGRVGGDVAGAFFHVDVDAAIAHDRVQRTHSASGMPTVEAIAPAPLLDAPRRADVQRVKVLLAAVSASTVAPSREAIDAAIDRAANETTTRLARPAWTFAHAADWRRSFPAPEATPGTALGLAAQFVRQWPTDPTPRFDTVGMQQFAEWLIARRDAAVVALALEAYRRQHAGAWPATLDALVPAMLPRVPLDRIDGRPLRYRVVDGAPVIYSVGVDRDDDGGRAPASRADRGSVARWSWDAALGRMPDGDWVLFDGRAGAHDDD